VRGGTSLRGWRTVLKKREPGLALLVVYVGPLSVQPIVVLPESWGLGVKMITPTLSPLHLTRTNSSILCLYADHRAISDENRWMK
jgi:hypothetical protein